VFKVLEFHANKRVEVFEGSSHIGPPPDGVIRWIDLSEQDSAQLEILRDRFDFHPLTIEDCAQFDQRPKVEEYDGYFFIVMHGLCCAKDDPASIEQREIHAFLGDRYLVTVHDQDIEALDNIWKRAVSDPGLAARGIDFIYYLVADAIVESNFPILDRIADELEEIESEVMERVHQEQLTRIFRIKRGLVTMRKALSPQRDMLSLLAKRGGEYVSERTALYFRDVYDHLVRITESIETSRDLVGNCLDAYLSMVSQRTNEIMKSLTIMSAVFLPLAFVVGFFGQNFVDLPGLPNWVESRSLMWFMIVLCASVPVAMIVWFRSRNWL